MYISLAMVGLGRTGLPHEEERVSVPLAAGRRSYKLTVTGKLRKREGTQKRFRQANDQLCNAGEDSWSSRPYRAHAASVQARSYGTRTATP